MTKFANLKRLLRDEGATGIEYGLIAALVSIAAINALGAMGDSLRHGVISYGGNNRRLPWVAHQEITPPSIFHHF